MSSTRRGVAAAYKAKLREGAGSIANRRKSRGMDRKNNRNDELSKRRNFPNDMSPVAEKHESEFVHQTRITKTKKGPKKEKGDNLLDRLKQWREDKKRRVEHDKRSAAAKPTFKVGAMARESEAELFKGSDVTKVSKNKTISKTNNVQKGKPATSNKTVDKKKTKVEEKKVPPPKKQPAKVKEPAPQTTRTSKLQVQRATKSTADLASKLTAAAAAKRNAAVSPKKFLRATRATTLQKKESVAAKKGLRSTKGVSKTTGNLLIAEKMDCVDSVEEEEEVSSLNELTSFKLTDDKADTSHEEDLTVFQPKEVPKLLTDFNFSGLTSASSNDNSSGAESRDESSNNRLSFAGLLLKPKGRSTRQSTMSTILDSDENVDSITNVPVENLITFTPGKSSRRSLRKSTQIKSVAETMEVNGAQNIPNLFNIGSTTPKSAKRKSVLISTWLNSPLTEEVLETEVSDDIQIHVVSSASQSARTKSVRKSIRLTTVEEDEDIPSINLIATPKTAKRKSMRKSMRLATQFEETAEESKSNGSKVSALTTPKSGRRKSTRQSKVLGSTGSKQFDDLHISDPDDSLNMDDSTTALSADMNLEKPVSVNNVDELLTPSTPLTSDSRRKSARKSLSLEQALDLVQSDSDNEMEVDPALHTLSDVDTQVPVVGVTSTPKDSTTPTQRKRKSMMNAAVVLSSIEDISPSLDKLPVSTPRSHSRRSSHGTRRSSVLRRRSRKSTATPAKRRVSESVGELDLNISNMSTPNSMRNIENIPRNSTPRRNVRRSTVISVSDEGTEVGRELEPALAYKVEKTALSAKASRILNELVIEKVDGEKSFFEVSFDESMRESKSQNNSINNIPLAKSINKTPQSNTTSPFTPRKSNDVTASNSSGVSTPLGTPMSALRARHSMALSSGFKEPGLPLSALRKAGSAQRRKTYCTPKSKTPEQMISILRKSPMVEMSRRRSRHVSSPAPVKGQYFRDLIQNETDRLNNLSDKWNDAVATEVGLSEDVLGQIRSTVGKAQLLMQQRFKQFSGLVDNYVYDLGEKKTTPTDLQGFWDMIYFQVEDVNNQFKDLEELQQSGWQVKTNTPKAAILKKKITNKGKPKTKSVKSNFAAFKAAMMKKKEMAKVTIDDTC